MSYTISEKGQVTLPAKVRKQIGVGPGDEIDYVIEDGRVVIKPARAEENPFTKWVGIANVTGKAVPAGTAVKWVRGLRDEEDEDSK